MPGLEVHLGVEEKPLASENPRHLVINHRPHSVAHLSSVHFYLTELGNVADPSRLEAETLNSTCCPVVLGLGSKAAAAAVETASGTGDTGSAFE